MALRIVIATFVLACWLCDCPFASAQVADSSELVAQQRRQYREGLKQYPLIKEHKINEVFRMRCDGAVLSLEPLLESDREYTQRRADLDGLREPAIILCWLISQDLGQVQFNFEVHNFSDALSFSELKLLARPNMTESGKQLEDVEIEKNWTSANGYRHIRFVQTNRTVTLQYTTDLVRPGDAAMTILTAKDFATLRREHHAEIEQLLRPIFHELHQEAALAASPAMAWQVLADRWPVDSKLEVNVRAQLAALDDDHFRVRQKAADALEKLGRDGALVMMRMDRRGLTLEQKVRLDEVIARFKPLSNTEADRLGKDPNFLLDCLYDDDEVARDLAMERLQTMMNKRIDFDQKAGEAIRVDAISALRAKLADEK